MPRPLISLCAGFVAVLAALCVCFAEESKDFASLEQQFKTLPSSARRMTGPLFWLHGTESKERFDFYLGKVAEGGNGCFTAESRPHSDWLGEGWWRDLSICLECAKKHDLQMWIFDEKWWPSQTVGCGKPQLKPGQRDNFYTQVGTVPKEFAAKRLEASKLDVKGPQNYESGDFAGPRYIATVAGRLTDDGKVEGNTLLDLSGNIRDGKLSWQVPAGKWRIMKFTHSQAPGVSQSGQLSVDGADKAAVEWFLKTVYQPHYDRFGADFGKTIPGFFFDEPETQGNWGTELKVVLNEWNVDWKKAYVAYKFELAGEEQTAAKFQYLDALAEAWGRTMYGGMSRWCREHNVKSIGHFMEHANLYRHPDYCAGDIMRLMGYCDMGGIDAVFKHFVMGRRICSDDPIWQTPKLGSSVSHVYGKQDDVAMVEIFGARGQDLTYSEMKWWTDHMQVSGINFIIPHSFNPKAPYDRDCPPYFYNGGFEPRWPLYRVYADYTSRLSLMLTGGRHVCPAAILFSGNLYQVGKGVGPEDMITALQDAQIDCDLLPMSVFEKTATLDGCEVKLHGERYKVLIVPPVEVIPYETLAKAKQFFEQGGIVIGYGMLPTKSAVPGKSAEDITQLRDAIWGQNAKAVLAACQLNTAGGRAYFLPESPGSEGVSSALVADGGIRPTLQVSTGQTDDNLHVLHRQKDNRDIFFVCNQIPYGPSRQFTFRVSAAGEPEIWDAMRNEITTPAFTRIDDKNIEITMALEPLESFLLVMQPQKIKRPARLEPSAKPIRESIVLTRIPSAPVEGPKPENTDGPFCLSPVGSADPFHGKATIPADVDLSACRVYLEMDELPDMSAAVTINGKKAGGVVGRPCRLEVGKLLKSGENQLLIEPLPPKAARLVFYSAE